MAVVFSIYVFQPRKSVTDAYSDSFYLVNSDFWLAFGSFLVLGIIYYIISMVFSLPAIIYSFVKIGISANEIDPSNMDDLVDPFYIFLNVLSSFIQFVLNIVLIIGGALIYFHLNEKKNFTGTYERIDKIGENLNG
jgi:predicted RND superfamily exporter protein